MASRGMGLELDEPFRRRVKLGRFWRIAILTFGWLLAWAVLGQIRLIGAALRGSGEGGAGLLPGPFPDQQPLR